MNSIQLWTHRTRPMCGTKYSFIFPFRIQSEIFGGYAAIHSLQCIRNRFRLVFRGFSEKREIEKKLNQVNWTRFVGRCFITLSIKLASAQDARYVMPIITTAKHTVNTLAFCCTMFTICIHTLLFAQEFYVYYSNGRAKQRRSCSVFTPGRTV